MNEVKPDPNAVYPLKNGKSVTYIRNTVKNPNIIVGDFSYFDGDDFESHVMHHYEFMGDKLIIGKFCQIASGVSFIMNGANHAMKGVTTYPFYIMQGWTQDAPPLSQLPLKGDTVIGHDVWIGQNVTIMPGVHIGDGAIIGLGSVVASDVAAYTVAAGNPARQIRRRFDDELIELLEEFRWWDLEIDEINEWIPILSDPNPEIARAALKKRLHR